MKKWKKWRLVGLLLSFLLIFLAGCQQNASQSSQTSSQVTSEKNYQEMSFDELKKAADGTEVTFYGWGGDEQLNNWLKNVYAPHMKEKYNITMKIVGMDIEDILNQLTNEKQANKTDSDIDMIWINGENFKTAKENDFLYGPFTNQLPNFKDYINAEDSEVQQDFGYPIDGFEAPYGKAQLVMMKDSAKAPETPKNAEEFLAFAKAHPGQVTYPALPDFTGSAFVRNIIYEFVDPAAFTEMKEVNKENVKKLIEPALAYLRELNPYLWNQGKTFPSSSTEQEKMYENGELVFHVSYGSFDNAIGLEEGRYPEKSETFIFDKGTIGNTNYMGIAKNSGNVPGAMVAINEMMSPEMQLSRYKELKNIPVIDNGKLSADQQKDFANVDLGKGILSQAELLKHRLPEPPAEFVPLIEEIWQEEVVGK
ncbi:MAG: ABC transporter substrate-binding protein [Aerococcus sp.]|nr:ABC transporter substrate-binding protein [Aerococcus sp.]